MTSIKRDAAARRRGELNRTSGGRRLSPAIDARRRLNGPRPGPGEISASHVGPRDPRYENLTHSHQRTAAGASSTRSTANRVHAASTNDEG
jgi:hypothetical protein